VVCVEGEVASGMREDNTWRVELFSGS
jgi:hypothetical protein